MSLSEADRQKLDEMLTALYDNSLDAAQTEELLHRLEEPEVRTCFAAHAMLDAYLSMETSDGIVLPIKPAIAPKELTALPAFRQSMHSSERF